VLINSVKHSYFYLRWSYNNSNTFLDLQTEIGYLNGRWVYTKDGLFHDSDGIGLDDSGFIDISVTLI
jgi:hypothetical protein